MGKSSPFGPGGPTIERPCSPLVPFSPGRPGIPLKPSFPDMPGNPIGPEFPVDFRKIKLK